MPKLYTIPATPVCKPHLLQRVPGARVAAPASLSKPVTSRVLPVQYPPRTVSVRSRSACCRAARPAVDCKAAEVQPWWRQLSKTALLLPFIAAAAFLKPPASSAQTAWQFWQKQPAARQQAQPAAWEEAQNFSAAAAGRWHRTVQSTAARTATVVLFTFTMFYTLSLSFQKPSSSTESSWRQRIHKQPAAQHRSALRRMAASGSQQQPAAAAVVGRTSSSRASGPRAKLSSPQLPLHAPQPFLPAQPPALLQPTTLPAVAPNSRAGGIPDSILQANGTAAGSSRLQVSSAGQTVSASTGQAPDSTSAADDDAAPSSGAAEPSTGSSPAEETVDMPADQVPPVAGVSEKVLERAKQLEKDDKAAQSPGTVLPPTEEANRKQDEAQPQASSSSPDGSAPNSAASLAVLPEQATHMQSEQETGQAEGLTAASEGGAFTFDSAAADDVLKSALQANPFGDMLDSLLRHQPTSHKLSDLYTKPATVDDPVNRALQGVIAHAGQGAPKRGPVHDLLHIADAAHAPERRPAPALLSALLKAEETQAPTPKQGLVHDLLHLSARVSTLTDNLGEVIPLRADPIADSLKAVSSVTDWSAQKWDPLAMGLQAGLAERSKAQPQDNPIASLGTVEEHSPIKRPSKYDPLPGILTGAAPSAKRNLDPFSGLMALALARGNAREAARAKRMALAASYPQASPKSDPQEANGHSIVADREPRPDQRLHRRSNGEHAELNGHSSGASASNGASPRVIMSNGVHNAAMPSNGASKSNGAQNGKHADGAVQLADVTPASAGNGKVVHGYASNCGMHD